MITREQAKAMHPSNFRRYVRAVWTPSDTAETLADFEAHAADAVRVVAEDTGTVIDFATRKRIS